MMGKNFDIDYVGSEKKTSLFIDDMTYLWHFSVGPFQNNHRFSLS